VTESEPNDQPRELTLEERARLVRRINEYFYRGLPHEYFRQRLLNLMLFAADSDRLFELIGDGVTLGNVTLRPLEPGDPPVEERDPNEQYLAIESTSLVHHAAETLLRLYMAHKGLGPCPWMEMTLLRYNFKTAVEETFPEASPRKEDLDALFPVFFLAPSRADIRFADDDLDPDLENVWHFVHHFAQMHLTEAPVYNSAKHGLGVVGADAGLSMEGGFDWRSLSLVGPVTDGRYPTHVQFRSVDVERYIAFTHVATQLMQQLWDVARARYLGEELKGVNLFVAPKFKDVLMNGKSFGIDHFNMPLWFWSAPPKAAE
jgi:hypothetical protein